jgi:hypothetical protein
MSRTYLIAGRTHHLSKSRATADAVMGATSIVTHLRTAYGLPTTLFKHLLPRVRARGEGECTDAHKKWYVINTRNFVEQLLVIIEDRIYFLV